MLALLTLYLTTAAADAEAVTLRHRFAAGEELTYTVSQQSAIDMRGEQHENQIAHTSETTRVATVSKVNADGSAVVSLTNVRAKLAADSPDGEPISYDSESDAEVPTQFEGVAHAIGKPLMEMTVSPTGEVLSVVSLQKVRADVEMANRSNLQPFVLLPEDAVTAGDQWKDVYQVTVRADDGFPLPVKMQRTFTLKAVEDGVATIAWRSVVRTPLSDPTLEGQLVSRELSGTIRFDVARGRMVSRTATGDRTVVGAAGPGTSMRTVTQRSETLIETVAAGDATPAR